MTTYKSQTNQTVIDVCMQTYGDLNQIYKLMQDSNFPGITTYPVPLIEFSFNEKMIADPVFSSYIKNNGITINTGIGQNSPVSQNVLGDDSGGIIGDDSGGMIAPD